jgi:hypothetical protein
VSFELDAKSTNESEQQSEKHDLPRISTDAGMQTDLSDEQETNANSPIRLIFGLGSKLIADRKVHSRKQPGPNRSIEDPMTKSLRVPKYRIRVSPLTSKRKLPETQEH